MGLGIWVFNTTYQSHRGSVDVLTTDAKQCLKTHGGALPVEFKWKQFKTRAKKRLIPIENVNRMLHDLLSRLSYKML